MASFRRSKHTSDASYKIAKLPTLGCCSNRRRAVTHWKLNSGCCLRRPFVPWPASCMPGLFETTTQWDARPPAKYGKRESDDDRPQSMPLESSSHGLSLTCPPMALSPQRNATAAAAVASRSEVRCRVASISSLSLTYSAFLLEGGCGQ